jgi:hypothetical protein
MDLLLGAPEAEAAAEEEDAATSRKLLLPGSAMNKFPEASNASAVGLKEALDDEDPEAELLDPFPFATATVVMEP